MDARLISFGLIEIGGRRFEHDVVVEGGVVRRRKKVASNCLPRLVQPYAALARRGDPVVGAWDLSVSSSTDASVAAAVDAMGAQRVYAVAYTPTTWTESVSAIFASRANATPG